MITTTYVNPQIYRNYMTFRQGYRLINCNYYSEPPVYYKKRLKCANR